MGQQSTPPPQPDRGPGISRPRRPDDVPIPVISGPNMPVFNPGAQSQPSALMNAKRQKEQGTMYPPQFDEAIKQYSTAQPNLSLDMILKGLLAAR